MFGKELNKQVRALEETNLSLQSTIEVLKQENANYKQTISAYVGTKTKHESEVANLKKKYETELTNLKQELETERKSLNRKVNKALADIGVKQFAAEEISVGAADDNRVKKASS